MAWNDELLRRSAKSIICVEMVLDTQTMYFADAALREEDKFWEPRVRSVGQILRTADPLGDSINFSDVMISLDNNSDTSSTGPGKFDSIILDEDLEGSTVNIYLKFVSASNEIFSELLYSGRIIPQTLTPTVFSFNLRPVIREKITIFQRDVNTGDFPNAPAQKIGEWLSIAGGTCNGVNGAVYCPIIDGTNRKIAIASHRITSASGFVKIKGDTVTAITPTATNYTDLDANFNEYASATLSVGDYDADASYYCDVQGLTTSSFLQNPVEIIAAMLINLGGMSVGDTDPDSFVAAKAEAASRGYAASGVTGGLISLRRATLEGDNNQWSTIQNIAKSTGSTLYITRGGKIGIAYIDTTTQTTDPYIVRYNSRNGDFLNVESSISNNLYPVNTINRVLTQFQTSHVARSGYENWVRGDNADSQAIVGVLDAVVNNRMTQDSTMAQDVLGRQMTLQSGKARLVTWRIPGLWGLQDDSDLGDIVEITHDRHYPDGQQVIITSVMVDLMARTTTLSGYAVGPNYQRGTIAFTGEEQDTLTADLDTYVDEFSPGSSYGTLSYFRHGEGADNDGENVHERCAIRFDLSGVTGTSIIAASLQLYIESAVYPSDWNIRQLLKTTWGDSSTWNAFENNGAGAGWSESNIGGTALTNTIVGASGGFITFSFNAAGLTYLTSVIGSDAHLTASVMDFEVGGRQERYRFSSSENTSAARRPKLSIVYT